MDLLKIDSYSNTSQFFDMNLDLGLLPTITRPSRITHSTATLIDNIYLSPNLSKHYKSGILTVHLSDHLPCFTFIANKHKEIKKPLKFKCRKLTENKIESIKHDIKNYDWSELSNMNTNDSFNKYQDVIKNILDKNAPEKNVTIPAKKCIMKNG